MKVRKRFPETKQTYFILFERKLRCPAKPIFQECEETAEVALLEKRVG
jgi:hypothetical protein